MRIVAVAAAALIALAFATPVLAQEAAPAETAAPAFAPPPSAAQETVIPPLPASPITPSAPSAAEAPPPAPFLTPPPPPAFGGVGIFGGSQLAVGAPAEPAKDVTKPEEGPRRQSDFHLDLGFGTEMPISVGAVVTAELPGRILLQGGAGFMPHGYAFAIDSLLSRAGAYDQIVSNLIRSSLGNSFVLKLSAGWRPFEGHGFEMLGGYTLITMGGSTTTADVINAGLAEAGSSQRVSTAMSQDIPLAATLHNVHASVGWRWLLAEDHMVIRASLSYVQCVASSMSVGSAATGTMATSVNQALNTFVGPYLTHYGKAPTLGLSAAYRF